MRAIMRRCTYPKIEVSKMCPILDGCNQPSFRPVKHRLRIEQMSPKLGRYSSSAISVYIGFTGENLQRPTVKAYIDAKMAEIESHKIADAKEAMEGISAINQQKKAKHNKGYNVKCAENQQINYYKILHRTMTLSQKTSDKLAV